MIRCRPEHSWRAGTEASPLSFFSWQSRREKRRWVRGLMEEKSWNDGQGLVASRTQCAYTAGHLAAWQGQLGCHSFKSASSVCPMSPVIAQCRQPVLQPRQCFPHQTIWPLHLTLRTCNGKVSTVSTSR